MPNHEAGPPRGAQYAAELYRRVLAEYQLAGSMSQRGNPYDNGQAESFIKTLKCEEVYLNDYQTLADVRNRSASAMKYTTSAGCTRR